MIEWLHDMWSLNVPYGALCFLTRVTWSSRRSPTSLNAPYGAPRFLTLRATEGKVSLDEVLMHLMVILAF